MNREPNSIRFWCLNAIEALLMQGKHYFRSELATLEKREAAVLERAQRIKAKGATK